MTQVTTESTVRKINVGCGAHAIKGWVNIDHQRIPGVDIVAEIDKLPYPENSADEILASHCIEHFPHTKTLEVIKSWHKVLKPGGVLNIATPDLEAIVYILINYGFSQWVLNILYGDQDSKDAFHYTCLCETELRNLLRQAGFNDIKRVRSFGKGLNDCSTLCYMNNGNMVPVSLNLTAVK